MTSTLAYTQGGLGNQCFIYATARALALRAGVSLTLDLDYLAEDYVYKRKLALDQFNCVFESKNLSCKVVRIVKLLRYKLLRDHCLHLGNLYIDKRPFCYRELPKSWRGTLILDGYWQSERYFYDAREQLLKDFQLKDVGWIDLDPVAREIKECDNSVFVHVRSYKEVPGKGDGQCARAMADYYSRAIAHIQECVTNPRFFVFSDDIELAKEIVGRGACKGRSEFVFVEPATLMDMPSGQIRDFTLMRLCKHGIVADSSFSWWAGWLGEQERLMNGEKPIRIRVNQIVMNKDFWPERWVAI